MTRQEVFDTVSIHLLKQNRRSFGIDKDSISGIESDTCLYRSPEGLKCAVGCLIKDEFYTQDLEGLGASNAFVEEALEKSGIDSGSLDVKRLLLNLQSLHDNDMPPKWEKSLRTVADAQGLDTKAMDRYLQENAVPPTKE